uniref:Lysosomal amino acid transporter 1 homolog n=1 Tax=Phallusia mammillata TaxID=59560 RepID=A0A6F9DS79_9ASCI|nr:lysosomal amino acid transporter 1 homolog [Phallusia mammillata]
MYPINPLTALLNDPYSNASGANITNSSCLAPDPIVWVHEIFDECIYNVKEEIGFIFGLISILCWICASLPQLYENYKKGKVDEALSFWFLLMWLLGDSSNMVGCILTDQFPIQLYTAVYYVSMDIIMLVQFVYYAWKHKRANKAQRGVINDAFMNSSGRPSERIICCLFFSIMLPFAMYQKSLNPSISYTSNSRIGRNILSVSKDPSFIVWTPKTIIGYAVGCISSAFYLGSRLPQIRKNYLRQQTEGVSPIMFFLAVSGNTLYGASILMQDPNPGHTWSEFLLFHMPWLIGSLGTLALDFTILIQILYYGNKCCTKKFKPVLLVEDNDQDNNPLLV